jgi:hypothetical protein
MPPNITMVVITQPISLRPKSMSLQPMSLKCNVINMPLRPMSPNFHHSNACHLGLVYMSMGLGHFTIKNIVLYNHSICDCITLFIICNYILSFLQLLIIFLKFLLFLWLWYNYKIAHPSMLTNFLIFSSKNKSLCSFGQQN